jgi:hypothetical protein
VASVGSSETPNPLRGLGAANRTSGSALNGTLAGLAVGAAGMVVIEKTCKSLGCLALYILSHLVPHVPFAVISYFPSTENASSTLPGMKPIVL